MSQIKIYWSHAETIVYLLKIMEQSLEKTLQYKGEDLATAHSFLSGEEREFDREFMDVQESMLAATRAMINVMETAIGLKKPGD